MGEVFGAKVDWSFPKDTMLHSLPLRSSWIYLEVRLNSSTHCGSIVDQHKGRRVRGHGVLCKKDGGLPGKSPGAPEDVYSQLSSCSLQVWVSMGYLDRSMLHVTVVVILKRGRGRKEMDSERVLWGRDGISSRGQLQEDFFSDSYGYVWLVASTQAFLRFSGLNDTHQTQLKLDPEWKKLECWHLRDKQPHYYRTDAFSSVLKTS